MSKLVLRNVGRTFGDFTAVENFNLALGEGELVSLLGPSGCGKTTTLRMIAGFMAPTAGTIEVDGQVVSSPASVLPPEKRRMSMIFQSYAIWPNMTVAENVGFGLKVRKLGDDEIRRRVDEILEVVQMGALRDRYPAELSGGQQQRVALARSIVVKPAVLLLDEPLSNLDANLREEMRFEIRRLHDEFRIAMVYVTHDQAEAMVTSGPHRRDEQGPHRADRRALRAVRPSADALRRRFHRAHQFPRGKALGRRGAVRGIFGAEGGPAIPRQPACGRSGLAAPAERPAAQGRSRRNARQLPRAGEAFSAAPTWANTGTTT